MRQPKKAAKTEAPKSRAAKTKPAPSEIVKWAQTSVARGGGGGCRICNHPDGDLRECVRIVVEERAAGRSQATIADLWRFLRERFGFEYGHSALRGHLASHTSWK